MDLAAGLFGCYRPARGAMRGDPSMGVAIGDFMGLTEQMRKFLGKNYLPAGDRRLRAAGRSLLFYWKNGRLAWRAPIYIPGDYVVLGGNKVLLETHVPKPRLASIREVHQLRQAFFGNGHGMRVASQLSS